MKKVIIIYLIYLLISEIVIQRVFGPKIKVLAYGPKMTQAGMIFNNSDNGAISSIWITTNKSVGKGAYLVWGNNKIEVTISKDVNLITAAVDSKYYQKRGIYFLQVVNPETGQKTNKIPFIVR